MKKTMEKLVSRTIEKKFPLFENVNVSTDKNPFRYHKYGERGLTYTVTLIINFETFLMEYWELWNKIKELIKDTIKIFGIEGDVNVHIGYSDCK